jgi:hypothetical protein
LTGENSTKVGLDDFFAAGHNVEDLMKLAVDCLPPRLTSRSVPLAYVADYKGLHMAKPNGELIPLSNFHAKITAILDDGHEVVPQYEITATRGDEKRVVSTPAEKFSSLSWLPKLPPRFNIHAGSTTRDRFRSSISSRTTGARDKLEGGRSTRLPEASTTCSTSAVTPSARAVHSSTKHRRIGLATADRGSRIAIGRAALKTARLSCVTRCSLV